MKNNMKKILALLCCAAMVITSGVFTTASNLKASNDSQTYQTSGEAASSSAASEDNSSSASASEAQKQTASGGAVQSAGSAQSAQNGQNAQTAQATQEADLSTAEKTQYQWTSEDGSLRVTATLSDPTAVPDDAQLTVEPVVSGSGDYDYKAYMKALNKSRSAGDDTWTPSNTLLYDFAFLGKASDGSSVEYEPAKGSVKLSVEFLDDQLSGDLEADSKKDIEIRHLAVSSDVLSQNNGVTKGADISAKDVTVEKVSDARVKLGSGEKADFSTDSFSVFAFKNGQQKNYWDGTTDYTYNQVLKMINKEDDTTNYAVYANELINHEHLEGNIKVGVLRATSPSADLNQDSRTLQNNAVTKIRVTKTLNKVLAKDRTFNFATYEEGNTSKPLDTFEITVPAGETKASVTLTEDNAKDTMEKVKKEDVAVYEMSGGSPVKDGDKAGDFRVSYEDNHVRSIETKSNYSNYIGTLIQDTQGKLIMNYFDNEGRGYMTYIENFTDPAWTGSNNSDENNNRDLTFTSDGHTVVVENYRNRDGGMKYIQKGDGITARVSGNLEYLKGVSSQLANAKNGAKEGEGSLSVINLRSTTGQLENDLNDGAEFNWVQNGTGIKNTLKENGFLLINIDATGYDTYYLQQLNIDGSGADNNYEELGRHVIYNIVQKDGDSYVPYTGKVKVINVAAGTVLAPAATYINEGGLRGEVIANKVDRSNGTEIHKDSLTTQRTARVIVNNSKEEKGKSSASVAFTGEKKLEGRDLKSGEFKFDLKDESGNVVETVSNDGKGGISFSKLNFDKPGEYHYTISEEAGSEAGVAYDSKVYNVTVTVKEDGTESLVANVSGLDKNGKASFTNRFSRAAAVISGSKTLNGGKLKAGDYRFQLRKDSPKGEIIDTAANDGSGEFYFSKLTYDKEGTYTYYITEEHGGQTLNDVAYDGHSEKVTVDVTRDQDTNALTAAVTYGNGGDGAAFTNTAAGQLQVKKIWNDSNDRSGLRPDRIAVQLHKGDKVVQSAVLSGDNGWEHVFTGLDADTSSYTVTEKALGDTSLEDLGYTAQIVYGTGDGGMRTATITNSLEKSVDITAKKTLKGAVLQDGEFVFKLTGNSDSSILQYGVCDESGNIRFQNVKYDSAGYTVTEVIPDDGSRDSKIAYDEGSITYDSQGRITSEKKSFVNTYKPMVLRIQKTSREEPHDPLQGAVYGLYQVVDGGNDVLVQTSTSDKNGYMYFDKVQEGVTYYFKEISAPAGHEVDPYPGVKFQIKYQDGVPSMVDESGNTLGSADVTKPNSSFDYVQNKEKVSLDSIKAGKGEIRYEAKSSDGSVEAVGITSRDAFVDASGKEIEPSMTVKKVKPSDAVKANLKASIGDYKDVVFYNITFRDSAGNEVEPATSVNVTIQPKAGVDTNGAASKDLKIVHLLNDSATAAAPVTGTISVSGGKLTQMSVNSASFSTFGVVDLAGNSTFSGNYVISASDTNVNDAVTKLEIAKIDSSGKYLPGAKMEIREAETGKVVASWTSGKEAEPFARWLDKGEPLNVGTYYVLHEVSAPEGYQLADDIVFAIGQYDSGITVYKTGADGGFVEDKDATEKLANTHTLKMMDIPITKVTRKETRKVVEQPDSVKVQKVIVKTGDNSVLMIWAALLVTAGVGLLTIMLTEHRRKNKLGHRQ